MSLLSILAVALALAVDAFAVAVASGVGLCRVSGRQVFRLAFHFGLFQALLNILGWSAGLGVRELLAGAGHWVAFTLLALIAAKMIVDGLRSPEENSRSRDPTRGVTLIMLSVATSIDALAVGLSFSLLRVSIWLPAAIIGLVATGLTVIGLRLGCLLGRATRLGARAEIGAGLVLLGIALQILHAP